MNNIFWLSASERGQAYRHAGLSHVPVVEHFFDRIRAVDPAPNASLYIDEQAALQATRQAQSDLGAGRDLGHVHGVPAEHKDVIDYQTSARNHAEYARVPFNLTGHPALSIMCEMSKSDMAIGMQIDVRHNREDMVFHVAAACQDATCWSEQHHLFRSTPPTMHFRSHR